MYFFVPVFSPVDLSLGTAMNLELLGELFSDPCVDTGAATLTGGLSMLAFTFENLLGSSCVSRNEIHVSGRPQPASTQQLQCSSLPPSLY